MMVSAVVVLVALLGCVSARMNGAPPAACTSLTPGHGVSSLQIPGGYFLYSTLLDNGGVYTPGMTYTVTLQRADLLSFRGFIIQARDANALPSSELIGTFVITDSTNSKLLTCSSNAVATVTHTSNTDKSYVSVNWTAPNNNGSVAFYYSVVRSYNSFYAFINSLSYRPPDPTPMPTNTPSATPPTSSPAEVTCPTVFTDESNSTILSFRSSSDCRRTNCDLYIGMSTNPMNSSFLDIYMEGNARGWIAVGFSESRSMENTDVVGCKREPDDTVSIVDTWNPSPNYAPNQLDDTQDGVCMITSSFSNGRIRCLFSRYGPALNSANDLNWNDRLYIIYGLRNEDNNGASFLLRHSSTPSRTSELINAFTASGPVQPSNYPEKALLQVHGILMLISWPLLASIAIFFASWMKPALPNGEWFQTHRALLIISLFVTVAGFMFAFIALAMNPIPGLISFRTNSHTAHFAIGIIVVLFQIANPIIAIFRCKPDSSWRWIFNILHASFVGVVAIILALTNAGIGLSLFSEKYPLGTSLIGLWIFIVYIGLVIIFEILLHVWFTISAFMAPKEDRYKLLPTIFQWCFKEPIAEKQEVGVEMKVEGDGEVKWTSDEKEKEEEKKERKPPSTDAPIRWVAVGIFLFLCLIILPVIVIVAIG